MLDKNLIKKLKVYLSDSDVAVFIEQAETNEKLREIAEALASSTAHRQANDPVAILELWKGDKGDEGEPGDDGYTPKVGIDFYTEAEKEKFKLEVIDLATPERGIDYFTQDDIDEFLMATTPTKGKDYFTKSEIKEFKKEVTPVKNKDYFDGEPGKNGSPDSPKDIIDKINKMEGVVDLKVLRGLKTYVLSLIPKGEKKTVKLYRGGSGGSSSGGTDDHALLSNLDYASSGHTGFEPAKGADDNYVTDAEKVVIGNTSGTNTGDQDLSGYFNKSADDTDDITVGSTNKFATAAEKTKLGHISVTQAVDLDAIETRVNALDTAVVLKGGWDASAGTFPGSGSAQAGDSYIVTVAGTVDGIAFALNDRLLAIADNASATVFGTDWLKLDYTDQVLSVVGLTGAISKAGLMAAIDLSGVNTGDQTSIVGIGGTKAEFDSALSDGNFLYVGDITGNATHTGEVTGSGALTVDKTAITNKSEVSAAVEDHVLIADASDSANLKKVTIQTIADLAAGSGVAEPLAIAYAVAL